ncbi:MAG: hypothetical protein QOF14_1578 [Hyphomicrobiales bacterium]|jgi:hypothetical protein|nr:hypothetical protein [Hyphomicrobiales bacterium]
MVTFIEMQAFARECQEWAQRTSNSSHRQTILGIADTWMRTAFALEQAVTNGAELALPDLRSKLD